MRFLKLVAIINHPDGEGLINLQLQSLIEELIVIRRSLNEQAHDNTQLSPIIADIDSFLKENGN